jgi:hypothetical protein
VSIVKMNDRTVIKYNKFYWFMDSFSLNLMVVIITETVDLQC